ncbi:Ig-like domain repeat protein [Friedmanniella luteola]|nr:Ig-like domain repeat protein [Friedmanniella luteola]
MLAIPRAIPVRARSLALGLPLLLTGLLVLSPAPAQAAPAPAPSTVAAVDPRDRASVAAVYHDVYLPAMAVRAPAAATDLRTTCRAGGTPAALQNATRDLVNYFRALSGVAPVTFDADYSARAQKAALIGYANNQLSHAPARSAVCFSEDGADAAARSNLALGYAGADVVRGYMDDAGEGNRAAGHRWWLQNPRTATMGNGTVGTANALWVAGEKSFTTAPRYTSWPSAGYVPAPLEPGGRWSFTTWDPDYDLSRATVGVTGPAGEVAVTQAPVDPTFGSLVFDVGAIARPEGSAASDYTVTVTGILKRGEPISPYRYTVALFDPDADLPLEATTEVAVTGTTQVGQVLTAVAPAWSLPGTTTTYQWFRGDLAIPDATGTALLLTSADTGSAIRVEATGRVAGRAPVVDRSEPTTLVTTPASVSVTATSPDQGEVRLSVTVAAAGEPAPSGTVDILEGETVVAPAVPLAAGRATRTLSGVTPGDRSYTVRFRGTARVSPATSPAAAVSVGGPVQAELEVRTASPAPGRLALDVVVTGKGEQQGPDGRLEVREGTALVGAPVAVTDGRAAWTASGLRPGAHTYTVRFLGSSRVAPASVTTVATVGDRATTTVAASATSPSVGVLTVAAAVTAAGQPASGGTVTIAEGTKTVVSGLPVTAGRATWTGQRLTSGRHTYTLRYSGTTAVKPATTTLATTVKAKVAPVLTLRASSPSSRKVTVAIAVKASGQTGLGGTVTVREGTRTLKSGLVVTSGKATWTATKVAAGKHTYTVSYGGTSQVAAGTAKVAVTVRR